MARGKKEPEHDSPLHSAARPSDVLAAWIVAILLLFTAFVLIGHERVLDRKPAPPAAFGTGEVLLGDHALAPGAIAAHSGDASPTSRHC